MFTNDCFELFILLLADDVVLLSETVTGLQTQLNSLQRASSSLQLKVNMSKSNKVVLRKGGYLGARLNYSTHCEMVGYPPAPVHEGQWPK